MNTKTIVVAVLLLLVLGAIAIFFSTPGGASGKVISSGKDFFEGTITNAKVSPGTLNGVSAYDRNCVGQPITQCDAGIQTKEYGLLNFHYAHNMAIQPCINENGPEKVVVEILDSNGAARVYRQM
jgi:hypothetical protein